MHTRTHTKKKIRSHLVQLGPLQWPRPTPRLKIGQLEMIYGERDWMDVRHGNEVAKATSQNIDRKHPTVVVQLIDAGRGSLGFDQEFWRTWGYVYKTYVTYVSSSITVPLAGFVERFYSPELCRRDRVSGFPFSLQAIQDNPSKSQLKVTRFTVYKCLQADS